jgi:hypothetical protein
MIRHLVDIALEFVFEFDEIDGLTPAIGTEPEFLFPHRMSQAPENHVIILIVEINGVDLIMAIIDGVRIHRNAL